MPGSSTTFSSQRPSSSFPPSTTVYQPPTSSSTSMQTDRTPPPTITTTTMMDTRPPPPPSSSTTNRMPPPPSSSSSSSRPTNSPPPPSTGRYPPENRYPSTERYPSSKDRYPTSKYPSSESTYPTGNSYGTVDKYRPSTYDESYPTTRPYPDAIISTNSPSPSGSSQDKFNFYQDSGPSVTYSYPMLYETNYPMPNDMNRYPNVYAQNVPTLPSSYYRPSYGEPTPTAAMMSYGGIDGSYRPTTSGNPYLPTTGLSMGRPTAPTQFYDGRYNQTDRYDTRPPMMSATGGSSGYQPSGEPIETYFNPDDYNPNSRKFVVFRRFESFDLFANF